MNNRNDTWKARQNGLAVEDADELIDALQLVKRHCPHFLSRRRLKQKLYLLKKILNDCLEEHAE